MAHGVSRGIKGPPRNSPAPEGRQNLLPDVPVVVGNPVSLQKGKEFLLKRNPAVMLILVTNVFHHGRDMGLADAEGPVPRLPGEGGVAPRFMNPHRRVGFEDAERVGDCQRGRERQETMNVAGPGIRINPLTAELANDSTHVSELNARRRA